MDAESTTITASITDRAVSSGGAEAPPHRPAIPLSARPERLVSGEPGGAGPDERERILPDLPLTWIAAGLALAFAVWLIATTPFARALEPVARPSLTLLAADGTPIAHRGPIVDAPVRVGELPPHVVHAVIAAEDRRFVVHHGIDTTALARAAWRNLTAGGVREGGSTITQQLARMTALDSDRNAARKLREMLLALWIELRLSKAEILGRYLSTAYFGDNVYGLRAAARHYFDRTPEALTVEQAAMLAGLVNAPSRLAPTRNLEGARARAGRVIEAMVRDNYLEPDAAAALPPARLDLGPMEEVPGGGYFADWIIAQLGEPGDRAVIETTLDPRLQRLAERAVARARLGGAQAALVAMRPDGRIVAMVGGLDHRRSPFNRAVQARRQPGSAFKLFVYLAAVRRGVTPDELIADMPVAIGDWAPQNHDGEYRGILTVRDAFALSSNSAAVQLSEWAGRERVAAAARDLGIDAELPGTSSLALGTASLSLIELTAAYAGIAGNAFPVHPHGLTADEARWSAWTRQQSLPDREWNMMLELLWAAANTGTGREAALSAPTFGKTGTSQDNRDALFVGFAENLIAGVWVGHDDNSPLRGVSGGGAPAAIWRDFMAGALGAAPAARPAPEARETRTRAERREQRARGRGRTRGRWW